MLTHRLSRLACCALLLTGCSTALPVDSPYDDDLPVDASAPFDASLPVDAGTLADARPPTDAGRDASADAGRDASVDAGRDAAVDAGRPHDCATELPTRGVASLLTSDCTLRAVSDCNGQASLDRELERIGLACLGTQYRTANLGFTLGSTGCPTQFRYEQEFVRGSISNCIQAVLERTRFSCRLECAVVQVVNRPVTN